MFFPCDGKYTNMQQEGAGECKYALSAIAHLKISVKPACIQTEYLENTEKHSLCPPKEKWTLPRKLYYINE